jgi:hypothetical protein
MHRFLWKLLFTASLSAGFASQACRGEVIETPGGISGTSGTSGTSGASGTGGAGGDTTGRCGSYPEVLCNADEFCAFDPPGECGGDDEAGTCQPRPEFCTEDCPGVCGCDMKFYCNACLAHQAGVGVTSVNNSCLTNGIVSAVGLATGAPRFMILKVDAARGLCFRLMVEGFGGPGLGIMTSGDWSVARAEVTDHVGDCTLPNSYPDPPVGGSAEATSGTGLLTIDNPFLPCKITIHATVSFDAQAPWTPLTEPIDADQLEVSGGCG